MEESTQVFREDNSRREKERFHFTGTCQLIPIDDKGQLLYMPVALFFAAGGQKLSAGDQLKITATYDNTSGKLLRQGAMGIVVGYFVPANDAQFTSFRHAAKTPPHNMPDMKDMPGMSHDQ